MNVRITFSVLGLLIAIVVIAWLSAYVRGRKDGRVAAALAKPTSPDGTITTMEARPDAPVRDGTWFLTRWAYRTGRRQTLNTA